MTFFLRRSPRPRPEAPRLLFLHIPKTAGSTLRRIIERRYGRRAVFSVGEATGADIDRLAGMTPQQLERIRAVVGHFPFGLHALLPDASTYVTLLREPADRIVSHFYYAARTSESPLFAEIEATGRNLRRYVEEAPAAAWFNNGQTRLLGSIDPRDAAPADRSTLDRAKARLLSDFAIVGLAERFDESLARIAARFAWPPGTRYGSEKISTNRVPLSEVSAEDLAVIRTRNALDEELYRFARELFERNVIPNAGPGSADEAPFPLSSPAGRVKSAQRIW
jgi:hypothetical protein